MSVEKDPTLWKPVVWFLAVGISVTGGIVNWLSKTKTNQPLGYSFIEFISEIVASGFVGLITFMVFDSLGQSIGISAAAAGIAGHTSTKLLGLIWELIQTVAAGVKSIIQSRIESYSSKKTKDE